MSKKYYEILKKDPFRKELYENCGTRIGNAILRHGIKSKNELENLLKEYTFKELHINGLGINSYFVLIDYLYSKKGA